MTTTEPFSLFCLDLVERPLASMKLGRERFHRLIVRAVLPILVVWLPLVLLEMLRVHREGQPGVPMLEDVTFHVRFLVIVPLLVLAGWPIDRQARLVAGRFASSGMIVGDDCARFANIVHGAAKRIRSPLVLVVIALLAFGTLGFVARTLTGDGTLDWFEDGVAGASSLKLVGWWYLVASGLPVFLFLRWAWRYLVWTWFLYRTSRLDLQLVPTHPDRAAGLGFVGIGHTPWALLGTALSASVAAAAATRIFHYGESFKTYQWGLLAIVVGILALLALPLLVFAGPLARARREGLSFHGEFSTRFARGMEQKMKDPAEPDVDIQSLADVGGSFSRIEEMRFVPIDARSRRLFAIAVAVPMVFLILATVPTEVILELLKKAFG